MTLRGRDKLAGVNADLVRLVERAALLMPLVVLEGVRSKERQATLVADGKSQTMNSRHLTGDAIDLAPDPIDWKDTKRFYVMYGYLRGLAESMDLAIRCGADWDGDFTYSDQTFHDLPHIEVRR